MHHAGDGSPRVAERAIASEENGGEEGRGAGDVTRLSWWWGWWWWGKGSARLAGWRRRTARMRVKGTRAGQARPASCRGVGRGAPASAAHGLHRPTGKGQGRSSGRGRERSGEIEKSQAAAAGSGLAGDTTARGAPAARRPEALPAAARHQRRRIRRRALNGTEEKARALGRLWRHRGAGGPGGAAAGSASRGSTAGDRAGRCATGSARAAAAGGLPPSPRRGSRRAGRRHCASPPQPVLERRRLAGRLILMKRGKREHSSADQRCCGGGTERGACGARRIRAP